MVWNCSFLILLILIAINLRHAILWQYSSKPRKSAHQPRKNLQKARKYYVNLRIRCLFVHPGQRLFAVVDTPYTRWHRKLVVCQTLVVK